jgi:hypothetical protein
MWLGRYESAEMFWRLHDCGVPAKHLLYTKLSHADFVTAWRPLRQGEGRQVGNGSGRTLRKAEDSVGLRRGSSVRDFEDDLVAVLSERALVQYGRR